MDLSKANLDYLEKDNPVKDAALTNIRAAAELGVNPDSVAKSRQLAGTLGLPEAVVADNPEAARAKAWTQAADSWLVDAPRTSTLLADPQNAKVAHDDVEALRNIEMLRRKAEETPWFSKEREEAVREYGRAMKDNWGITRAYNAMDYQLEKVAPLAKRQMHNVLSTGVEDEALDVELFRAKALAPEAPQPENLFETAVYSAAELLPIIVNFIGAYAAGGAAGGAGAAITVAPGFFTPATAPAAVGTALAGAGMGAKIAGAKSVFDLESSLFFSDISDVRDENGEPLDPMIKAGGAIIYGAGVSILDLTGFSALAKVLPGWSKLTKEVLGPLIKEGLKDKAVQAALRDVAMRYAGGVGVETLTELGQEALSIITGIASQSVSESMDGTYFAPTDWAAQAERMKDVGVKTLLGTALLGVVPAGASAVVEGRNAARVQTWRDQQVELHTAIQASQTMQRSPETMKAFGDILGLGEEAWIDAEALAQRGPELMQRIGVDPEVVAQAAQDGVMIRLDTSRLMYEAEYPDLLQDLRPAPSAMSAREAESYDPVQALRDIEEAAIDAETVVAEVVAVKDRMRQTLEARGLGETLDANWELASRLSRMLSPKGDPTAFVQKLNVMADVVERQAGSQVDQQRGLASPDQQTIDALTSEIWAAQQTWDRANRMGRNIEWIAGAASASGAFTALGDLAHNIPAHGMAKVGTLQEGVTALLNMLNGGIDPNRTLFTAGLTAPAGTGAGMGTGDGSAYKDGPFILVFRQGVTGNPTSADIAGVLVNPAHSELVNPLQQMFPNLTIRDYAGAADVVAASMGQTQADSQVALQQDAAYAGVENEAEIEEAARLWAEMGTESPYFKRWFGESKVVDESGKPLVVYHGTRDDIDEFKDIPEKKNDAGWLGRGFYFSNKPDLANFYARQKYGPAGENVIPAYLSLRNPYRATMEEKKALKDADRAGRGEEAANAFRDKLIAEGYDGVILDFGMADGTQEIVAFDPTQIKSATGNRGTFDPADARILYQPELTDRIVNALNSQEGPTTSDEVAAPPTLYQVQNLPEWKDKTRAWMQKNGYSQDEISRHMAAIEGQMKIFGALGPVQLEMLPQGAGIAPAKGKISGPIRSNADAIYKITFDASAMCVKRLEAAATAAEVERRLGRPLVASERMALVALFKSAGKQAPCLYCYVEAPRSKRATLMQQAQDVIQGNTKPKSSWSAKTKNALAAAQEEYNALGLTEIDPRVVTDPEFAETPEGKELRKRMPKIFAAMELVGAGATANLPKLYEEYNGQILALPQKLLDELNNYAGLRFFSSSDFQAEHVADLMQAFFDMEIRRAKSHAYTKVPDYVRIFGPTGQKIQTSIFAKEENGEIVMDDWQGMDWETARAFREQYPNVGTVLVAGSDAIVAWGLEQDWVDYIIPFHYSGLEKKFYETLGWQDFTATQNEKSIGKGKAKKIRMHETGAVGGITTEQGTRNYLALAMERKLVPVFPAFLFKDGAEPVLDKKGKPVKNQRLAQTKRAVERWKAVVAAGEIDWDVINPNYYKVKKDYARTDTPFEPVRAEFNLDQADNVLQAFLRGEAPSAKVDTDIADKLQSMIASAPIGFDIGVDALAKVRRGITLNQAAWHGSPYRFSKFSLDHMGSGEGAQAYGWGLYFASRKEIADWYREKLADNDIHSGLLVIDGEEMDWKAAIDRFFPDPVANKTWKKIGENKAARHSGSYQMFMRADLMPAIREEMGLSKEEYGRVDFPNNPGQLYKVEIPEDDVLLLWDRPLSEQPEKVREALGFASVEEARDYWRSIQDRLDAATADLDMEAMDSYDYLEEYGARADAALTDEERAKEKMAQAFMDNRKGVEFYRNLQVTLGSDKAASEYLNSLGIKGIKYLDGTSRSQGEGSYNYVIFDDQTIQILETFYQQQNSGPRGAYNQLKDGSHLVRLFEQANASTMPHELAHAFLTELRAMAETGVADEAMLNDLQKIEAWLDREAVEGSPEWQSYYEDGLTQGMNEAQARDRATFILRHEKFARGFEQYLWEGKAPEPELEGVFARFSRWLKQIYKDALAFGVNLDPEIRSVFDRMLKADAEVESKVMELGFTPMTEKLAKHLGLGPEDRDYAVRLYSAALEKAEAKLAQARNKGLKKLRAEWKKDATEEAKQSREHQMLYMLRKGRGIDKAEFLALYGDEAAKGLPRGVLREGGLSLNEAAFEHNYDTHEQMVNDLWNYRKPEDIAAEVVEARTAERDATFKVEDFILETAEFAAYQELMAKAYDKDGNVLSNKAFRDYARKIVATMPLADAMDVRGFLAAMARHHKAETKALKAGKLADAAKANKKARLNHAYAQEALNVRKRVEKAERMAKRLTKLKAGQIEEGHHKALLQLIQRFGLTKKDYSGLQDVPALADLVKLQDAFGADEEASFSQWLLSGEARNYKDLTSGEFEELQDLMKFLYGTGKDMIRPTLKVSGLDMDEVKEKLVPQIEALPKRGKRRKEGTWLRKMQDQVQSYLSQNRTILWIIRELDGYTALKGVVGPLEKWLYEPLEAANLKRAELSRQLEKRTRKARAQLLKSATAKANKVSLVNLPVPPAWQRQGRVWDFDACLSVLMNMGNAVNRQRVMDGYNLTDQDLQKILAVFSQEDAQAVQDIWTAMDEILWPEIAGTHKKLRFYTPGKVQAEAFTMPDGTVMRGGYYPLKYDPSADTRAARNQDLDKAVQNPSTAMLPKSVASGATRARAQSAGGMPVLLRTSVLSGHLDWAVHYASHALIIHDLGKVLGDVQIAEAIKTAAGEETFRAANELVKRIANPRAGDAPSFLDAVFNKLTGISAVYSMWMNRFGPLTQPTAIGNYIAAEGGWGKGTATWMKGTAHFLANPAKQWNWLMENNPALQNHFTLIRQQLSQAIGEDFRDIQLGKTKSGRIWTATKETVIRGGIAMYGVMDAVVSVPGWYGSYLRGLDERLSPEEAVVRANKIMAEYTPMSRDMDKTLFQHTKGMARAWTYMMSYFTKQANTNAGFWKAWRQGAIGTDQFIGQIVAVQILPAVVVSMMYSLLTGDDDDRDNILLDAGLEVAAYPFAGLPFAREGAAWAANLARAGITGDTKKLGRNAFQMPGMMYLQLMQRAGSTTYAMVQDFDDDEAQAKALMAMAELTAATAGLPPVPKVAKEVMRGLDDIDDDEGNILNVLIKPKIRKRD